MQRQNLGEMLLAANLIDEVQMQIAVAEQKQSGRKFGSTLVDLKFIDENVLAAFLSRQIDVPCISLLNIDVPRKVMRRISGKVARDCEAIPIRVDENRIEVAMVDPTDLDHIQLLENASGMVVVPLIAPQSSIRKMIERFYPPDDDDTQSTRMARAAAGETVDPMFSDLIAEIENGDFEQRLERIEEGLQQIWTLLEKILRLVESRESASESHRK